MRPRTWSLLAAIAVIGSMVFSSASPGAAQETEGTPTVPTTIPGGASGSAGSQETPEDPGGTSMANPVPLDWSGVPQGLRPRMGPSNDSARQDQVRQFRIPIDGELVEVTVARSSITSSSADQGGVQQLASIQYQTDLVAPADFAPIHDPVYNVDHYVWIATRGCTDSETCSGGVRKSSGYTWFVPINVELGDSLNENEYGLHGGLALGGSGQKNKWYVDWSGYYGPDHPQDGDPLPGSPKQSYLNLAENHWYRLRVWRVSCSGTGNYGWLLAVKDITAGTAEKQIGTFCLHADTISEAYYFAEIIEPDPCDTDFWGTHSQNIHFRGSGGAFLFPSGVGIYIDNTCGVPPGGNTNLRSPNPSIEYTIDERETARGSNGGITQNGQQLWP